MARLIVFLVLLAVVVYAVFWLIDRRNEGRGHDGDTGRQPRPRGPVGPDDDDDFLRELERKRRHNQD